MVNYKCMKCGYEWTPKVDDPKECPECKSRYWDKPNQLNKED